MLRHFIQKVHQNRWAHPRVVVCVPSGVTGVEKRAVEEACLSAGARQAYLIEEPMAAAIGAGLPVGEPTGNMVVDIGGGTSEVAVISLGGIVVSQSIRVGGDELDEAIINYVKREYKLLIGQQTAEEVKLEIGSAYPLEEEVQAEIRGRDIVSGLPKTVVLTSEEVRAALEEPLVQIIDAIKETLDRTPPELASDIMDRGIMLAGGGSLLQGLDERLREETQMPAHLAESPLTCVAVGSGRSLEEFEAIHRSNRNNNSRNRAAQAMTYANHFGDTFRMYDKAVRRRRAVLGLLVAALADPAHRLLRRVQLRRSAQRPARRAGGPRPDPGGREPRVKPFRDLFGWFGDTLDAKDERDELKKERDELRQRGHPAPGRRAPRTSSSAACSTSTPAGGMKAYEPVDRARHRPLAEHLVLDGRDRQGLERRRARRPAGDQRRGPRRQGQVGLRRQRDRDADHRPGVRRLRRPPRSGEPGSSTPRSARPATCCSSSSRAASSSRKGERIVTAGTVSTRLTSLFPPGHPDRHASRVDEARASSTAASTCARSPTCAGSTTSRS